MQEMCKSLLHRTQHKVNSFKNKTKISNQGGRQCSVSCTVHLQLFTNNDMLPESPYNKQIRSTLSVQLMAYSIRIYSVHHHSIHYNLLVSNLIFKGTGHKVYTVLESILIALLLLCNNVFRLLKINSYDAYSF